MRYFPNHKKVLVAAVCLFFCNAVFAHSCSPEVAAKIDLRPSINGWGINSKNHRFISEADAGVTKDNLARLRPKWVFALPDTKSPHSQPFITPDTVYIGDEPGVVYALDRDSGCEKWRFDASTTVRTALRFMTYEHDGKQHNLLTFGTAGGEVFGIDPRTGVQRWRIRGDAHAKAMVSGSSIDHKGVIFQPVSSWEAMWAVNPFYKCCTFRSSVIAIDPASGELIWRSYTVLEEPRLVKKNRIWPNHYGPSGAPVWSQPSLDKKRNRLYVGTGENYSSPSTDTSDAIIAMDLETGKIVWHKQLLASDAWNVACESPLDANCPSERGSDLDFGAPPILVTVGGRDIILAGQKNGSVYALDPARDGKLLWQQKPGTGGKLGGIHFSMGVDEARGVLYVPVSDREVKLMGDNPPGEPNPSLHAYDIVSGNKLWSTPAPNICMDGDERIDGCFPGLSAAVTVTENLVFAPSLDGHIRVFDARSGKHIWAFDTRGEFPAVNAKTASGGSIDLGGVYLDGGQLFVNAGYGTLGQSAGNAFMVLEVGEP
ncbi:MAG: PQQ-binding-like beta-propeller repeat protein [Spongiibacteraceae bacterium]